MHELAVLAATVEHLVHSETIKHLADVFNVTQRLPTDVMNETEAQEVLDTYMMFYILGDDSQLLLKCLGLRGRGELSF